MKLDLSPGTKVFIPPNMTFRQWLIYRFFYRGGWYTVSDDLALHRCEEQTPVKTPPPARVLLVTSRAKMLRQPYFPNFRVVTFDTAQNAMGGRFDVIIVVWTRGAEGARSGREERIIDELVKPRLVQGGRLLEL